MWYMVGMYIAAVPNRSSPPAILLREAFRENGKVKNRTLANLSHWPAARIEALRRALRGDFDHAEPASAQLGPVFGLLFVLKHIADMLGLTAALGKTALGKLALFLVLARVAHRGSRLSAVRWAQDQAVEEVLALPGFDEDDLYEALEDLCARQEKIEAALYTRYLGQNAAPPRMFLYDVTSSYFEGVNNELGAFGYNRDGKKGKLQIVIGLLSDGEGEPLAVRVMSGNTADSTTVVDQIKILQNQFQVKDVIFVGDRGMVKSKGKQALQAGNLHYITALTDPQIRRLLHQGTLQLGLFHEQVCEVESDGVRYILRKNEAEAARERRRLEDKLAKLETKIGSRNQAVKQKPRSNPEAGQRKLEAWAAQHKLTGLVEFKLEGRAITLTRDLTAIDKALELAGCYVVTSDVTKQELSAQQVHDGYLRLQKVERDFRAIKTGLLEVRPIFLRDEKRTRGHVLCCMLALKLTREMERRLRLRFGTTDSNPHAVTLPDALAALSSLCLLHYSVDEKNTVTKLPQPTANQQQILAALGVSLPVM
jgi:transposase